MESLPLSRLESNITCSICHGYLIDATTITECMHTFCKSCLLQRMESGRTCCPSCGVQLQRSRLSEQLRLDHAIQALVYAAVPGLWQKEQRRRQHFVDHHPLSTSVAPPLLAPTCFSPADPISLSLDFVPPSEGSDVVNLGPQALVRRFFRCPAAVAVHHFQKLLSLKFELPPHCFVEIYCSGEKLDSKFRLMDVAYKTGWTQEEPLRLEYKIERKQTTKTVAVVTAAGSSSNSNKQHQQKPGRPSADLGSSTSTAGTTANKGSSLKRPRPTTNTASTTPQHPPPKLPRLDRNEEPKIKKDRVKKVSKKKTKTPKKKPNLIVRIRNPNPSKKTTRSITTPEVEEEELEPVKEVSNPLPQLVINSSGSPKKRGRRKRRKHSEDILGQLSPSSSSKDASPPPSLLNNKVKEKTDWSTLPSGVELLVQAAALASRQNPTPPPTPSLPPPEPTKTPQPEDSSRDGHEDDGQLLIADDLHNNSSSNGRDSGMALNDDDLSVQDDDSSGALDLTVTASKAVSVRSAPSPLISVSPIGIERKSISPMLQQRSSTLHSITDILAQKQQQRLIQQQKKEQTTEIPPSKVDSIQQDQQPLMRDLMTLSRTAALVASANSANNNVVNNNPSTHHLLPPLAPEQAASQATRLIVAMHQFAAAAAAAAASAPKTPPQNKSLPYANLIRRPF